MLKIREYDDNGNKIDLKELEKYGFEKYKNTYSTDVNKDIYLEDLDLDVNLKTKEIYIYTEDEVYEMKIGIKCLDYLYDLIKADLVEKVKE